MTFHSADTSASCIVIGGGAGRGRRRRRSGHGRRYPEAISLGYRVPSIVQAFFASQYILGSGRDKWLDTPTKLNSDKGRD